MARALVASGAALVGGCVARAALVACCVAPLAGALAAGCGRSTTALPWAASIAPYPTPHFVDEEHVALPIESACLDATALPSPSLADVDAATLIHAAGLASVAPGTRCDLTLVFDAATPAALDGEAAAAWSAAGPERYVVVARVDGERAVARLWADSPRGALWALSGALALVDEDRRLHPAVVVDAPTVALRGLIEGYYGTPLSPAERGCLFDTMLRLRLDTYLYGPKDDPYAHAEWPDPYPPEAAAAIVLAAGEARQRGIDFIWSISPGLLDNAAPPGNSIQYSSAADFARVTAKIDSVRALGVDRFALFLDDTSPDLAWDADKAAYASLADAQADLANRLDAYVVGLGLPHLVFVGNVYSKNWDGWQDYVRDLGAHLEPGIAVLWTGPNVYSEAITPADVADVDALVGRPVVIWDNEPDRPTGVDGRAPDLPSAVGGYLWNTVLIEQGYSFTDVLSMVGTVADYAWNPAAYEPTRSLALWRARGGRCP